MISRLIVIAVLLATVSAFVSASASGGSDARCSTTDEGVYPCRFRLIDDSGSFEITAPGKPTYVLNIIAPGVAHGFLDLGEGGVPLPGRYLRSDDDRACWQNDATGTEICAW